MFPQRTILRSSQRLGAQLRTSRNTIRRRFASTEESGFKGAENNTFNNERKAVKDHAAGTSDLWRKLSIYAVIPCLLISSANAYKLWTEHWSHWEHLEPLEERPEFPYQNLRTRNYFWGNGDKTLFWNDKVNYHKPAE